MLHVKRLHHVQICIPPGEENAARKFYGDVLGLKEIPKPPALIENGGLWYQIGEHELHIGVDTKSAEKSKCHPALEITGVTDARKKLESAGIKTQDEKPIPGFDRFSFRDPFGNRIELIERQTTGEIKESVHNQFSKNPDKYVNSVVHAKGEDLQELIEEVKQLHVSRAIDIATGGGHVANGIAPYVGEVIATDLTPAMLNAARAFIEKNGHQNVRYQQADAEMIPFDDKYFNLMTCRIASHHFSDVQAFLGEAHRTIKLGGTLILIDNVSPEDDELDQFYNEIEKMRDPSHVRAYKKSEWVGMIERHGFNIDKIRIFKKAIDFDFWCDRMSVSPAQKKEVEQKMLNTSTRGRELLQLDVEDGHIRTFQLESVFVVAKRGS